LPQTTADPTLVETTTTVVEINKGNGQARG
jgi:hypothetical protein